MTNNDEEEDFLIGGLEKLTDDFGIKPKTPLNLDYQGADKTLHDALEVAAEEDQEDIIMPDIVDLVKLAPNKDVQNTEGWTALHFAAAIPDIQAFHALRKLGAKLDVKNQEELSPLDFIKMFEYGAYPDFDDIIEEVERQEAHSPDNPSSKLLELDPQPSRKNSKKNHR